MRLALAAALTVALAGALSAGAAVAQDYAAPAAQPQMNGAPGYPAQGGAGMGAGGYANRPPATPEQRAARQAARQACAADMQKLCGDAQTTGQRPMQCLRQHMADVSPGCGQAMQAMRAARQGGGGMAPGAGPQG